MKQSLSLSCIFLRRYKPWHWATVACIRVMLIYLFQKGGLTISLLQLLEAGYYAHCEGVVQIVLSYLSAGIAMVPTLLFLKQPLCEEYYYTRCCNRAVAFAAKVLSTIGNVLVLHMSELLTASAIVLIGNGQWNGLYELIPVFLRACILRANLSLVIILLDTLTDHITAVYIFLTELIFAELFVNRRFLSPVWILNLSRTPVLFYSISCECLLFLLLLLAAGRREYRRDIIGKEAVDRNG